MHKQVKLDWGFNILLAVICSSSNFFILLGVTSGTGVVSLG